jgi:hypothetical protein
MGNRSAVTCFAAALSLVMTLSGGSAADAAARVKSHSNTNNNRAGPVATVDANHGAFAGKRVHHPVAAHVDDHKNVSDGASKGHATE